MITAVITQIYIPTGELVIWARTKSNDANAETERYIETVETKISNCST